MNENVHPTRASFRAAEAIDRRRIDQACAHPCAGFDCAICSWKASDLSDIAAIIEREFNVAAIACLLRKLQELAPEVGAGVNDSVGHALALDDNNRSEGIAICPWVFAESRVLLQRLLGTEDAPENRCQNSTIVLEEEVKARTE